MTTTWFLHDRPVELIGPGPFGLQLRDQLGEVQWVFAKGQKVYECLGKEPRPMPSDALSCQQCSWERLVYRCGDSCGGYIRSGGCG